MTFEIFASYSHHDARFVKPLIKFLQPTGVPVFRDEDAIVPGKKWAVEIAAAIKDCRLLYLFWCSHSAFSEEVRKEYEHALALKKAVVPVLLDDTALPATLKEYQWVDLRSALGAHQQVIEQKLSREEGLERQRLNREAHGYRDSEHGYFGGDFARDGWEPREGGYVRRVTVAQEISVEAIQRAGAVLLADLSARALQTG
jgi:hypothetical protein